MPKPPDKYYGIKQGTTFAEIYSIMDDTGERVIHQQLRDHAAYEAWHLSVLFKEIMSYKKLLKSKKLSLQNVPRKEKNLLVYMILSCRPRMRKVIELGSALFELIDGLETVDKYLRDNHSAIPSLNLKKLSFIGVEISELLSSGSLVMHPQHHITVYNSYKKVKERFDILYDRNVTSYAFTSAKKLAKFINLSEVALLNLFVSKGDTFISARMGKSLTYFSLKELVPCLRKPLYHLFGEKAPGPFSGHDLSKGKPSIEGFFLYADPDFATDFVNHAQRDPAVKAYFKEKHIAPKDALSLLET